jgi:hypothetical protein
MREHFAQSTVYIYIYIYIYIRMHTSPARVHVYNNGYVRKYMIMYNII